MTHDLLRDQIEDMPIIMDWNLRQMMGSIFEVPTSDVRARLPKGLQPMEPRPGISLMFVGMNHFNDGNIILGEERPAFLEATRFFIVHPDLSIDMPVPRFTFFVDRIGSNDPKFVEQEIQMLHLPLYYSSSMRIERLDDDLSARMIDDDGPIQDIMNTGSAAVFRNEEFYGQYYSSENGKLYLGVWYCKGDAYIHQKPGRGGGIHDHPFLSDIKNSVTPSLERRPYMQLLGRNGVPLRQVFYRPRCVRELV